MNQVNNAAQIGMILEEENKRTKEKKAKGMK